MMKMQPDRFDEAAAQCLEAPRFPHQRHPTNAAGESRAVGMFYVSLKDRLRTVSRKAGVTYPGKIWNIT